MPTCLRSVFVTLGSCNAHAHIIGSSGRRSKQHRDFRAATLRESGDLFALVILVVVVVEGVVLVVVVIVIVVVMGLSLRNTSFAAVAPDEWVGNTKKNLHQE